MNLISLKMKLYTIYALFTYLLTLTNAVEFKCKTNVLNLIDIYDNKLIPITSIDDQITVIRQYENTYRYIKLECIDDLPTITIVNIPVPEFYGNNEVLEVYFKNVVPYNVSISLTINDVTYQCDRLKVDRLTTCTFINKWHLFTHNYSMVFHVHNGNRLTNIAATKENIKCSLSLPRITWNRFDYPSNISFEVQNHEANNKYKVTVYNLIDSIHIRDKMFTINSNTFTHEIGNHSVCVHIRRIVDNFPCRSYDYSVAVPKASILKSCDSCYVHNGDNTFILYELDNNTKQNVEELYAYIEYNNDINKNKTHTLSDYDYTIRAYPKITRPVLNPIDIDNITTNGTFTSGIYKLNDYINSSVVRFPIYPEYFYNITIIAKLSDGTYLKSDIIKVLPKNDTYANSDTSECKILSTRDQPITYYNLRCNDTQYTLVGTNNQKLFITDFTRYYKFTPPTGSYLSQWCVLTKRRNLKNVPLSINSKSCFN